MSLTKPVKTKWPERPKTRSGLVTQAIGNEVMVYDGRLDKVHILNPTALAIWECCDGGHDVDQLHGELKKRFNVAEDRDLLSDIHSVLERFVKEDLIE